MSTNDGVHNYDSHLVWEGSTGGGGRGYDRGHRVVTPPASTELILSADPHFRGDRERTNPEQLLVAAASSCQLLSFLAVAAREGIDVLAYEDDARGVMPGDDPPVRLTGIHLTATITVAPGTDADRVHELVVEASSYQTVETYLGRGTAVVLSALVIIGVLVWRRRRHRADGQDHNPTNRSR